MFVCDINNFKRNLAHQFAGVKLVKKKTFLSNNFENEVGAVDTVI